MYCCQRRSALGVDAAEVIGTGLEIRALGMGHRQVAARLGLADGTIRGWIRRFRRRSEDDRQHFTVTLVALADDPVMPDPAASPLSEAIPYRSLARSWWRGCGDAEAGSGVLHPAVGVRRSDGYTVAGAAVVAADRGPPQSQAYFLAWAGQAVAAVTPPPQYRKVAVGHLGQQDLCSVVAGSLLCRPQQGGAEAGALSLGIDGEEFDFCDLCGQPGLRGPPGVGVSVDQADRGKEVDQSGRSSRARPSAHEESAGAVWHGDLTVRRAQRFGEVPGLVLGTGCG